MIEVLCQNDPYRYVKMPDLLENGQPDYRFKSGITTMDTKTCISAIILCSLKLLLMILNTPNG